MPRKKELLSSLLARTGVLSAALALRGPRSQDLPVLAYHRVYDIDDEDRFPCDPELISASTDTFARQMEFVQRNYRALGLAELVDLVERKAQLPPNSLLITFDDGHLDNYTHAFPILRTLNLPATIFLSTGYIGGTEQFWFDRFATLAFYAPAGAHTVPGVGALQLGDVASRRAATERIQGHAKHLPNAQRLQFGVLLENLWASHVPAGASMPCGALTWEQVREMGRHRIEFGSHGVSHPIMSTLDDATLRFELAQSRRTIQQETGQRCDVIAYPVGHEYAFDRRVAPLARECGYRLGFSYVSGVDSLDALDPFAIRRIEVERYIPFDFFVARLAIPRLFL